MEEQQKLKNDKIEEMIYEVRGQLVMLDSDLAKLFGYKDGAKSINKSVMRHINYFTEKEYYQLSNNEWNNLRFQIGTSKTDLRSQSVTSSSYGGRRYSPYVFTFEGIKILSTILRKSEVPLITSEIILAFENIKNKNGESLAIPLNKGDRIENMIYEIRGKQVMLDSDLALLYECSNGTKTINQAVKRHLERFPDDFYFQLTEDECVTLSKSQLGTLNEIKRGMNIKKLPYVFTEQGVAMLATILRTPVAEKVSVNIMRAFVSMRKYIGDALMEQTLINNQVLSNTKNIEQNSQDIKKLKELVFQFDNEKNVNAIFFAGQIYDAFSKILDIMREAKKELIIIDPYADKIVLDMISNLEIGVIFIIKNNGNLSDLSISKYNEQYNNLKVIRTDSSHDRFFVLDRNIVYHCGTSINHAGRGIFAINLIEDEFLKNAFLKWIIELVDNNA